MSLRARLTLIYGLLLLVVFVVLGFGAEIVMQGRFADQTHSRVTSEVNYVFNNYSVTQTSPISRHIKWHLPPQNPFAGVYLELVDAGGSTLDTSANLTPADALKVDLKAVTNALNDRVDTTMQVRLLGQPLEVYYTPMPRFSLFRVSPAAVLIVATSESDISHALDVFNAALFGGEALIWVLAVVVTWLVAGAALHPIKGMTERAASIAATSDFSGRVPVDTRAAELQRLAVTFNRMLESLQKAYANQQRFLADASHELRTPLTILKGNLHYLEEAPDAPLSDRTEALHAARLEADRMGVLVGDLLALSQADAGYTIHRAPVELDRIVVDAFGRIQARERNLHPGALQFRLDRLDEVVVEGDYEKLLQLVLILLDNAVKYTPTRPGYSGSVTLELALEPPDQAVIRVTDTGLGIAPDVRDHIFERFYRSKEARGLGEGSGLGLPIARWIAEAHGGTIDFHANANRGTTFEVTLPVSPDESSVPFTPDRDESALAAASRT
jgi:signal transduction histidine kinase